MAYLISLLCWIKGLFGRKAVVSPAPQTTPPLTPYRAEIKRLWMSACIDFKHIDDISWAAQQILVNQPRYERVGQSLGIPFYVIGAIHMRESNFNFRTHLANGDPLFNILGKPVKTTHAPTGLGPFADWESGAIAALVAQGWRSGYHWDLINALENLRDFNGQGYELFHDINSPYLWSMSNHYKAGKYVADGSFDPLVVDKQVGCVAVLLALKSRGVDLNEVGIA